MEIDEPAGPQSRALEQVAKYDGADEPAKTTEHADHPSDDADLVGSTALSQRLDIEALREVNLAYQKTATSAIERFGGSVARYMGDGVLAVSSWPCLCWRFRGR